MISLPVDKQIELLDLAGLELDGDQHLRNPKSFRRVDNFDLVNTGALRKSKGLDDLVFCMSYAPEWIVEARTYRRKAEEELLIIGVSNQGNLYNLVTGALAADPLNVATTRPFVAVVQGSERVGAAAAYPINYLIYTTDDGSLWMWNGGAGVPVRVGAAGPSGPQLKAWVYGVSGHSDSQKGLQILVARKYRYVFYNRQTRHETSPSEDRLDITVGVETVVYPNSTLPDKPYVASVFLVCEGPSVAIYNQGYQYIRLYATLDGGGDFFLVRDAITRLQSDNSWHTTDDDGALPTEPGVNLDVFDGVRDSADPDGTAYLTIAPAIEPDTAPAPIGNIRLPARDQMLVELGPDLGENDPPPLADWGSVYQGRVWLVNKEIPSRLVFSKILDFQSYPADNFINISADDYDPIIALNSQYQQLIIGKQNSSHRLIGSSFEDFVLTPLDKRTGVVGRRALESIEGMLVFLSKQGIMKWQTDIPEFYGRRIKPLTDAIRDVDKLNDVLVTQNSRNGILLMSHLVPGAELSSIIMMDVSRESPFTVYGPFLDRVTMLNEVELEDGNRAVLMGTSNGGVYQLFKGGEPEAVLETQLLPPEPMRKRVFRRLVVEGILDNFVYSLSVDGRPFTSERPLRNYNFLGVVGTYLVIRISHTNYVDPDDPRPQIAYMRIDLADIGETRS